MKLVGNLSVLLLFFWAFPSEILAQQLRDGTRRQIQQQRGDKNHRKLTVEEFLAKRDDWTGSPRERRHLASLGDEATEEDWRLLALKIRERYSKLQGHYVQHVSKAAGTSVCEAFQSLESCGGERIRVSTSNCYENLNTYDQSPKWVRYNSSFDEYFELEPWMVFGAHPRKTMTCQDNLDILQYDFSRNRNQPKYLSMSENWIPDDGVCPQFLNTITLRHPLERLISHFHHIVWRCTENYINHLEYDEIYREENNPCFSVFDSNWRYNVTITNQIFDVVTDNYLLRTLGGGPVYTAPFGFNGRGQEYLKQASDTLTKFDWIMLLDNSIERDLSKENNDLIFQIGLGMPLAVPVANKSLRPSIQHILHRKGKPVTEEGAAKLNEINQFDLTLWKLAKRLHNLDVESIRQLQQYNLSLQPGQSSTCCGNICPNNLFSADYHHN